jgi:pyroglutamyl-peptidase
MALTILLSGFGPFPGAPSNPTGALVQRLARLRRPALADVRLVAHVFQTSYEAVDRELPQLLSQLRPDAVLMFGLASRASSLQVETRARNAVSALVLDAEGRQAASLCIAPGRPDALLFGVPAARLALAARKARIQAVTSRDAGRYLCNYLSWRAIEAAARPGGPNFAAFIHVPKLREAAVRRGARGRRWRMRDLLRGGEAILLAAAAETRRRRHMKER